MLKIKIVYFKYVNKIIIKISKMFKYIKIVLKNFKSRKLRSFLTLLGIVIGIIAIILLYSFADGMQDLVSNQFEAMGTNKVWIAAKGLNFGEPSGSQGLTERDAEVVEKVKGVDFVEYMFSDSLPVKIKNTEIVMRVEGVAMKNVQYFYEMFDTKADKGRLFYNGESGNIVMIGSRIGKIFDTELYPNNKIEINDKNFKIVGIMQETGQRSNDRSIQIPIDAMREITNTEDEISGITAVVLAGTDSEESADDIERKLKRARDDENFLVMTPAQVREQAEETLGVVKLVVLAIAAVSLVVGGLGIMNSLYTSVLERTKEIGIMKAIGAKNVDILNIFLLEAGMLGLIGGLISLFIGFLIIQAANVILAQVAMFDLVIRLKPEIAAGAMVFAIVIGMVAGFFPAYRAMKLKPVDALRYE